MHEVLRVYNRHSDINMATSGIMGLVVTAEHLRHCFTMPAQVKGVTGNYSCSVQVQYCNTALLEFN